MGRPTEDRDRCSLCRHFMDDPEEMEAQIPGIQALGSMYASVRGDSGFCRIHQRFMHAKDWCERFEERSPEGS